MPKTLLACALLTLLAGPAMAQADQTGTGSGPMSTITAPNTNSFGVTKPPAGTEDYTEGGNPDRLTRTERRENEMMSGICIGCGAK
ncbi:hypothetical protein Q8W71_09550 [Methylobacterium sp. NEAU 140]|uniref:hypothetical protein n=1 Tax=Methylobacterium sp. NEAU 140 TaxID=3064945 RepID=UPI0027357B5A|nr:hypothetical protein [Methylobacterium sp. NEAU 140]MDP4022866.1 hypothetical protein [Methylobacterium sp. NEAU 140]